MVEGKEIDELERKMTAWFSVRDQGDVTQTVFPLMRCGSVQSYFNAGYGI